MKTGYHFRKEVKVTFVSEVGISLKAVRDCVTKYEQDMSKK